MKKSLIALAALAAASVASAQSSVTLFGIVDATYAHGSGDASDKTQLTNSGYNSSRLGFRGTEDLGGGMSASFWLEAGVNNDNGSGAATNVNNQAAATSLAFNPATGANASPRASNQGLTFNRRSTVSLGGGFGELRLGRDYTPQFHNLTVFDPFGTNGVGTTQLLNAIALTAAEGGAAVPTAIRASNSIGYFLPGNLGGFYGQLQYSLGENASGGANEDDGNGLGLRFGWAGGPLNVAVALSKTDYIAGDVEQNNVGAQFDLGVAKLLGQYAWDSLADVDGKGFLIGALVPVGAGEIRASYSEYKVEVAGGDPKTKKFAVGYVHNLSKRTALYATYATLENDNGAFQALNGATTTASGKSNGYDIGIRHSF